MFSRHLMGVLSPTMPTKRIDLYGYDDHRAAQLIIWKKNTVTEGLLSSCAGMKKVNGRRHSGRQLMVVARA